MFDWTEWNDKVVKEFHGDIFNYRKLYNGEHIELFPRAQRLIEEQEAYDADDIDGKVSINVKTPYIIANLAKPICEIPANYVSRSIGAVKTSIPFNERTGEAGAADNQIDGPEGDAVNNRVDDLQQETIKQITKNSRLQFKHWQNIVQHQVDGGIVGVPIMDHLGVRLDFKKRDLYFPHEDGLGIDLAYYKTVGTGTSKKEYLHVYRERVEIDEEDENRRSLVTSNMLYEIGTDTKTSLLDEDLAKEILKMDELERVFEGRSTPFVLFWSNVPTFDEPLGRSVLKGQFGRQDEINWTLTKASSIFTKNGEPKTAVTKEVFQAAQDKAYERYRDENVIDYRDLNIITYDANGKSLELIQLDTSKIGNMEWVRSQQRDMLAETLTSEKAVDLFSEGSGAQSGEAKWYDLLTSIMKAEQIRGEYIAFLKELYESALWLVHYEEELKNGKGNARIIIEEPDIEMKEMIPYSRKELVDENINAYEKGVQSLETTIRNIHPYASDEWIQRELERLGEAEEEEAAAYPPDEDLPTDEEEEDDPLPGEGE